MPLCRWVSDNKFKIVNPDLLAEYWGQVKETTSMEWTKIKKVIMINLLLRGIIPPFFLDFRFVHKKESDLSVFRRGTALLVSLISPNLKELK